ncbi:CWF19-like protein 1 [Galendromus occidentalis]|uniref:CWF19-like protein 1 n=1 Tax=Galendromus occidentalis TaxID=34638 RepID=A0AAJ7PB56_9ACAR|nr:CWF19-like protein 1 [Galendromus occidentalis]
MSKTLRILVCGDVNGKFDQLYKRIRSILSKGQQFDSLFVVGEFFSPFAGTLSAWESYASGEKQVPIATYILGPKSENLSKFFENAKDGTELCPNIIFMGTRGVITLAGGLRVAYFSGTDCGSVKSSNHTYSLQDVHKYLRPLVSSETNIDILLTSDWPAGIMKYAAINKKASSMAGSSGIAQIAYFLKPRYHFTASKDFFYERAPFRNHVILTEKPIQASRFISLSNVGSKEKNIYAFSIIPMVYASIAEVSKQPDDTTENPYPAFDLPREEEKSFQGFFYDQKTSHDEPRKKKQRRDNAPRLQQISQDDCWFCLQSPKVAKHLVCSVGDTCYIAMAKGAIVPHHCLLLPIGHHRNMSDLELDTRIELAKYKEALNRLFASKEMYAVYFERNYKCSHMQLQVVPISTKISEKEVQSAFADYGASVGVKLEVIPRNTDISQAVPQGQAYFFAEFGNTKMLARIKGDFPINFGREVVCCSDILDMCERSDWKHCTVSEREETEMTRSFRDDFKSFDFTLDDDDNE